VDAIANDVDDTSFVEHEVIAQQPEPEVPKITFSAPAKIVMEPEVSGGKGSCNPDDPFVKLIANNAITSEEKQVVEETAVEDAVEDAVEEVVEEAVEEVNLIEGMTKEDYDIYKDMQALTEEEEALPEMDRDMIRLEKEEEASLFKRKAKKAN